MNPEAGLPNGPMALTAVPHLKTHFREGVYVCVGTRASVFGPSTVPFSVYLASIIFYLQADASPWQELDKQ